MQEVPHFHFFPSPTGECIENLTGIYEPLQQVQGQLGLLLQVFTNDAKMFTQTKISEPTCLLFHNRQAPFQELFHYTKGKKKACVEGRGLCSKFRVLCVLTENFNYERSADPLSYATFFAVECLGIKARHLHPSKAIYIPWLGFNPS